MKKFLFKSKDILLFNLLFLTALYLFACLDQKTFNINNWSNTCLHYVSSAGFITFIVYLLINDKIFK